MTRFFSISKLINIIETAKTSDRWLLRTLLLLVVGTVIWLIIIINQLLSVTGISAGGSFTEGIIGTPRFVNPALALTRADQDVTALIYSGLMKINADGELVPDVAESITLSEDGFTYTITLRTDVTFHDGEQLTATDVVFTIGLVLNNELKSPLRGNWSGVVAEAIDEQTVLITLTEPYTPFVENFTLGILPEHIWQPIPIEQVPFSEFNTTPIGSGSYKIKDAVFSRSGTVNEYQLIAAEGYKTPLISEIDITFFTNEADLLQAMQDNQVQATSYLSAIQTAALDQEQWNIRETALPRTFGLFFNQNRSTTLRDAAVREALELAIDREVLIEQAINGAGIPSPTAISIVKSTLESEEASTNTFVPPSNADRLEAARSLLEDADWTKSELGIWEKEIDDSAVPLAITIRTANTPELDSVLTYIAETWRELGVSVQTEQYEQTDLVQSVIRPRDFSVLLFGLDISRSKDLYPFWHSSQQDDPGLNISQYANLSVDELLSDARTATDEGERLESLIAASDIISEERPAIFLFQPTSLYVTSNSISTTPVTSIGRAADRFSTITNWHTDTSALWPFFRDEVEET